MKRIVLFVLVSWATYVAADFVLSWAMNHELELANSLIVGLLMVGITAWALTRMHSDKKIIAYVPHSELKEDVEWTDLAVVRHYLQDQDEAFEKAEVCVNPDGLVFRFSRLFSWQSYAVVIKALEDGLHLRGDDSGFLFSGEDYFIRNKVLVAHHLLAREMA